MSRLISEEFLELIEKYKEQDSSALSLHLAKYHCKDHIEVSNAVKAKQKLKDKLPEWYHNPRVYIPDITIAEQASSTKTSTFRASFFKEFNTAIDLTGGLGVDIISLAKNIPNTIYVEPDKKRYKAFLNNVEALGPFSIESYNGTAELFLDEHFLSYIKGRRILLYLDPDRRPGEKNVGKGFRVYHPLESEPNLKIIIEKVKRIQETTDIQCTLLVKLSPMFDITELLKTIEGITEVYVIAVDGDLKELCARIDIDNSLLNKRPRVIVAHLVGDRQETEQFYWGQQTNIKVDPKLGRYLYLPNPTLSKVGMEYSSWATALWQPASSTKIYFSDIMISNFPGRKFKVQQEHSWQKRSLRELQGERVGLIVRNFDLTVDQLRSKLKVLDDEVRYLLAYRDNENKRHLIEINKF